MPGLNTCRGGSKGLPLDPARYHRNNEPVPGPRHTRFRRYCNPLWRRPPVRPRRQQHAGIPGFNGGRLTLGYWLDDAQTYAIEGRGFALQSRSAGYAARSNATGSPNINISFANTVTFSPIGAPNLIERPEETGFPASQANILTGGVTITNSLKFWGADATGVMVLHKSPTWQLSALGGVRYLDLAEKFTLALDLAGVSPGFFAGESGSLYDVFETRNQFYGASLGLRGRYLYGPITIEMSGRVSLGLSHERLTVYGGYQAFNFGAPGIVSTGWEAFMRSHPIQEVSCPTTSP